MTKIKGTNVDLRFLAKPAGGYAPIFYGRSDGARALASVNAGNFQALDVGGGGINYGFNEVLKLTQETSTSRSSRTSSNSQMSSTI